MLKKLLTYHKVDEAGNPEADTSEDSSKHKTSRYTDSKRNREIF